MEKTYGNSLENIRAFFKDFPVGGHFLKRDLSVR
jgi:hypothetical protein